MYLVHLEPEYLSAGWALDGLKVPRQPPAPILRSDPVCIRDGAFVYLEVTGGAVDQALSVSGYPSEIEHTLRRQLAFHL